jgi:hypothetical protein
MEVGISFSSLLHVYSKGFINVVVCCVFCVAIKTTLARQAKSIGAIGTSTSTVIITKK